MSDGVLWFTAHIHGKRLGCSNTAFIARAAGLITLDRPSSSRSGAFGIAPRCSCDERIPPPPPIVCAVSMSSSRKASSSKVPSQGAARDPRNHPDQPKTSLRPERKLPLSRGEAVAKRILNPQVRGESDPAAAVASVQNVMKPGRTLPKNAAHFLPFPN